MEMTSMHTHMKYLTILKLGYNFKYYCALLIYQIQNN